MRILTVLGGDNFPDDKDSMAAFRLTTEQRELGKRRLKMASVLQFTLPGVPCVYYGDEAGMEGCADPFNRGCYPWGDEDEELREWYRSLAGIRKSQPAFAEGEYKLICARGGLFVFSRNEVIVAVNAAETDAELPLDTALYNLIEDKKEEKYIVPGGGAGIYIGITRGANIG